MQVFAHVLSRCDLFCFFFSPQLGTCVSQDANPAANITWLKNNKPLVADGKGVCSNRLTKQLFGEVLTFINMTYWIAFIFSSWACHCKLFFTDELCCTVCGVLCFGHYTVVPCFQTELFVSRSSRDFHPELRAGRPRHWPLHHYLHTGVLGREGRRGRPVRLQHSARRGCRAGVLSHVLHHHLWVTKLHYEHSPEHTLCIRANTVYSWAASQSNLSTKWDKSAGWWWLLQFHDQLRLWKVNTLFYTFLPRRRLFQFFQCVVFFGLLAGNLRPARRRP